MAPSQAWRSEPLPPDWPLIRRGILERDGHRCTWFPGSEPNGEDYSLCYSHPYRCTNTATDVDHISGASNHDHTNLRSLCARHHAPKTASNAARARKTNKNSSYDALTRRNTHPGLKSSPSDLGDLPR